MPANPSRRSWILAAVAAGLLADSATAADYEAAFARAKRCAEADLETRLAVTLEVRPFTARDGLPESEYGGPPVAFFDPAGRTLAVDPGRCRTTLLSRAKTVREVNDIVFVLLLHELLHAYQAGVIARQPGEREFDKKWVRFLCEGHAVHFSKELAVADGVDRVLLDQVWGADRRTGFSGDVRHDAEALRSQLYYAASVSYVKGRCKRAGDFVDLLAAARSPFGYAAALGQHPAAASDRPAELLRQLRDDGAAAPVARLDYLEAMAAVAPKAFPSPDVIRSFRGAAAADYHRPATGQTVSVVVLLFTTPDAAKKCLEVERGDRAASPAGDREAARPVPGPAAPGPRGAGQSEHAAVQIGPFVTRVSLSPAAADQQPLSLPLARRLLADLSHDVGNKP